MKIYSKALVLQTVLFSTLSVAAQEDIIEIGNGQFYSYVLKAGSGQPSVLFCDVNSDGDQDLIIADYSDNNIVVYQGDGKGHLNELNRIPAGDNPTHMDAADINGDGNIDIAIANHETSYITLLLGDGKGGFAQASHSPIKVDVDPHPHAVTLADLDGDDIEDLIVDDRTNTGLRVLKGKDNGQFVSQGTLIKAGGDPYRGFAVDDINDDGSLDMVTPNPSAIGIMINKVDKESLGFSLQTLDMSEAPFAVELADLNGDAHKDLIVATNGRVISIVPGDGKGGFTKKLESTLTVASGAKQIAVGYLNGDGIEDALISNWSGHFTIIFGGNDDFETVNLDHPEIANPWAVAMADLNNDGLSDMIIADGDSELAVVYVSKPMSR